MTRTRPLMPTGWAWMCGCGYQTERHPDLAEAEHRRYGHLNWHEHTGYPQHQDEQRTA